MKSRPWRLLVVSIVLLSVVVLPDSLHAQWLEQVSGTPGLGTRENASQLQVATPSPAIDPPLCERIEPRPRLPAQLEEDVRTVVQDRLDSLYAQEKLGSPWQVLEVWGEGDWAVIECVVLGPGDSKIETEGRLVLARSEGQRWSDGRDRRSTAQKVDQKVLRLTRNPARSPCRRLESPSRCTRGSGSRRCPRSASRSRFPKG